MTNAAKSSDWESAREVLRAMLLDATHYDAVLNAWPARHRRFAVDGDDGITQIRSPFPPVRSTDIVAFTFDRVRRCGIDRISAAGVEAFYHVLKQVFTLTQEQFQSEYMSAVRDAQALRR